MENKIENVIPNQTNTQPKGQSKTGIGVICALFLGLIGLLIGFLLYKHDKPNMEYEWKTFFKGWLITFCVAVGVSIVVSVIVVITAAAAATSVTNTALETMQSFNY